MVYLFEVKLSDEKAVVFALTQIYGINKPSSVKICKKLGFSSNLKIKDLSKEQTSKLLKVIESLNMELAGELKKIKLLTLKKLINIKSYKGFRRNQGLPIRGQRTHTNAKTSKKTR
jgi:small subunit ribosomal protein S13